MSKITVNDRRGGLYRTVIDFTYGECDRLPFNILRRINAKIELVPDGGITATSDFNIRNPKESAMFLETLDLFGENGSYVHGSPSDLTLLAEIRPSEGPLRPAVVMDAGKDDDDLEMVVES